MKYYEFDVIFSTLYLSMLLEPYSKRRILVELPDKVCMIREISSSSSDTTCSVVVAAFKFSSG